VRGKEHTSLFFAEAVEINKKNCLLSVAMDISQRKKYEEQIRYQAYHDLLTGLPNRRLFEERLRYIIADARRMQKKVAVLFLDLDGFKQVNDTLGHEAGDKVLRKTALNLTRCLRETDMVARMGGDEFMIILPHLESPDDAMPVIERILNACRKKFGNDQVKIPVSASMGAAFFPENGTKATTLMKNADIAMYQAKDAGRDRVVFYEEQMEKQSC
jgi:diguanylate cyclase (GGDEF)-like protein